MTLECRGQADSDEVDCLPTWQLIIVRNLREAERQRRERAMDNLKQLIADEVAVQAEREIAPRIERIGGVESVSAHRVDNLNIQLRVRLSNGMPRYFNLKLSEAI